MLKKVDWSDKFLTGHREVDTQHQYFVELINRVIWNMMEHNDWRYHQMLIEELVLYARFHFKSEENILYILWEPVLQEHKKMHIELIDSLSSRVLVIKKVQRIPSY